MKYKVLLVTTYILFLVLLIILFVNDIQNIDIVAYSVKLFLKYSVVFAVASVLLLAINSVLRLKNPVKFFPNSTSYNIILLALFCVGIVLPLLGLALGTESRTINYENRKLAEKPALNMNTLSSWAGQLTAYFNDNFGFRKTLISLNSYIKVKFLNTSTVHDVILGKDGWLYYRESVEDSLGTTLFTPEEVLSVKHVIERQSKWMEDRGIYYLIVIAPNKETIYPEYLPDTFSPSNHLTKLDQLLTDIGTNQNVHILDLRDSLLKSKKSEDFDLYYRTDTHWNSYGAYIGYNEIVKKLAEHFPILVLPSSFGATVIQNPTPYSGDLANMLDLHGVLNEKAPSTISKGSSPEANKIYKTVIFRDSFFHGLSPYFDINFDQSVDYSATDKFDPNVLTQDPPQVVLVICVQRQMTDILGWVNQLIPAQ
jgi:hypothetical protein